MFKQTFRSTVGSKEKLEQSELRSLIMHFAIPLETFEGIWFSSEINLGKFNLEIPSRQSMFTDIKFV